MKNKITVNKNQYSALDFSKKPLPIRIFNWLERILEKRGKSLVDLSADSLMEKAVRKTGLSDWGDDESFRISLSLKLLLELYKKEPILNPFGRWVFSKRTIGLLCNRLCIQDEIKRHPEILDEEISRPLFIVSLPRTGTTLLHNLLSQDPSSRYLRFWEAIAPSLHPKHLTKKSDPRIAAGKRLAWLMERFVPELKEAHPTLAAELPEECFPLIELSFPCEILSVIIGLQQYKNCIKRQDNTPIYRYYKQVLQLLQWHLRGNHWVLKAPVHLFYLEALLTVFPDACIIQTHRDPLKVVASSCSGMAMAARRFYNDHLNIKSASEGIADRGANLLAHADEVRRSTEPAQFYDVYYKDLMKDPVGTVRDIYQYFGYNYDESMDKRIQNWLAKNRQHKKGVHRYSLDQFGLDEETINRKFANYTRHYNVPKESL